MARFLNAVNFNPTLGGTTDWVVASNVLGFMTPAEAGAVTGVYKYRAEAADLSQWEIGEGTYTTGTTTLTRTTVLYNSSGTGTGPGQSGAGTKINFTVPPYVAIVQATEDTLALDNANAFSAAQRAQARQNISAALQGYIAGLTLSTAGSSAVFGTDIGECASSDGTDLMRLTSAFTKTTSAWVVGTGNGSLDTGVIANNTWYHVHLIKRPDTSVVDVLISLSATTPTLPANYTLSRRIGSMKTNGSAQWHAFTQVGDYFMWASLQTDVAGTSGTASVTHTLSFVPTGVVVKALVTASAFATGAPSATRIRALLEADAAVSFPNSNLWDPTAGSGETCDMEVLTNTSAQVASRASVALTAGGGLTLRTKGWIDFRGAPASSGNVATVVLQQYLSGLTLSTAGSSATFAVAAGQATDSSNADYMTLAASISKTTSAWAVGSTAGALDTGAIANNTWYHVFLIKRPDTGAVDVLISLSATTPTMPANYTLKRRIGSLRTNGSAQWTKFSQLGDEFLWDVPVNNVSSEVTPTVATSVTVTVPSGVQVHANLIFRCDYVSAAAAVFMSSLDQADTTPAITTTSLVPNVANTNPVDTVSIRTNTSSQVRVRATGSGSTYIITTLGWKDTRGAPTSSGASNTVPVIQNYLTGLTLSTGGGSAIFGVAAGQATDSGNSEYMNLNSAFTKTYAAWAAGTSNGSLDTGTVATNTWYHVYLIKSLSLNTVDVLISLSATAPTMPAGYTLKRRIGSMRTEATPVWIKFTQDGDEFLWDTLVTDLSISNPGTVATLRTITVPTGVQVRSLVSIVTQTQSNTQPDARVTVTSPDQSSANTSVNVGIYASFTAAGSSQNALVTSEMTVRTNTSGQIRTKNIASDANTFLAIFTKGWMDPRGR